MFLFSGGYGDSCLAVVEKYNPKADKWVKCRDMNVPRYNCRACVIDSRLCVGG